MTHPSKDDLAGYVDGRLPRKRFEEIDQHIEQCRLCETVVEDLSSHNVGLAADLQEQSSVEAWQQDTVVSNSADARREVSDADTERLEFGDYELIEEIARGGMGVVFKARQKNANRIVALKMILSGTLAGKEQIDRFYAEAEAAASLDHPNIVPVFDVGIHESQHYFSMAFVDGQSLSQQTSEQTLAPREAASLIVDLAHAVQYAHSRGIVHRDLKPANILLDANGTPRISDFGLAKRTETDSGMTTTGQIMGTPGYMAPEQARGDTDQVGPSADIYALGAVLYQTVTGRAPFRAASVIETLDQVIHKEPVAPSQLNPGVDRDLDTIILKALHKDPQKRYAKAADFADDVTRFIEHRPILARRTSTTERVVRWARRNRMLAFSLVATAVALLATAAVSTCAAFVFRSQANEELRLRKKMTESLYVAELNTADDALRQSHLHQTTSNILSHWYPGNPKYSTFVADGTQDPRGWEWYFLWGLTRRNRINAPGAVHYADVSSEGLLGFGFANNFAITQFGQTSGGVTWNAHETETVCVGFSQDGKLFATAGLNSDVKIWNVQSRSEIVTLPHPATVRALSFDSTAANLVTHAEDACIRIWNLGTNSIDRTIVDDVSSVPSAQISPDDQFIAGGTETDQSFPVAVWELKTGRLKKQFIDDAHRRSVESVDWSPDGQKILSGSSDRSVCVWDANSGQRLLRLTEHHQPVYAVAWSADGTTIASAGDDMEVYLRDATTGVQTGGFGHEAGEASSVRSLSWDSLSKKLVGAVESGVIDIIDLGIRQCLYEYRMKDVPPDAQLSALQFHSDDIQLYATRGDQNVHWRFESGKTSSPKESLTCWSHDHSLSGSMRGRDLIIRKRDVAVCEHALGQRPGELLWSPTSNTLAVRLRDSVHVWRNNDNAAAPVLFYEIEPESNAEIDSMTWSSDGTKLVIGTSHGFVRIHHAADGKKDTAIRLGERGFQKVRVRAIAWKPDSSIFAIGTSSNYIFVYDYRTLPRKEGDKLDDRGITGHDSHLQSLSWSPDGTRLASASADRTVRVWDLDIDRLEDVTVRNVLTIPHHADVRAVLWSHNGMRLASLTDDGMLSVFDATDGHEWAKWLDANPAQIRWE